MTNLVAVLLALVMALSGTSAMVAEAPELEGGVALEMSVNVNAEAIGNLAALSGEAVDEETGAIISALTGIINQAAVKAAIDENGAQADVTLKDQSILSLSIAPTEDGVAVATNGVADGDFAFTVKAETIQAALEQMQSAMPTNVDPNAIAEAVLPHIEKLMEDFSAKIGETETGEFTVDGYQFTAKTPINVTTKELAAMGLTCVRGILSEKALAPILELADDLDVDEIDEALAQVEAADDADVPVTEAALYANENGENYFVADMTKDGEAIAIRSGTVGGREIVTVDVLGQSRIAAEVTPTDDGVTLKLVLENEGETVAELNGEAAVSENGGSLKLRLDAEEMYIAAALEAEQTGDAVAVTCALYFNDEAPLLTVNAKVVPGADVAPLTLEGKTVIALEDLMDDQDGAVSGQAEALAENLLNDVLAKAMGAMPEEFSNIMMMFLPTDVTRVEEETVEVEAPEAEALEPEKTVELVAADPADLVGKWQGEEEGEKLILNEDGTALYSLYINDEEGQATFDFPGLWGEEDGTIYLNLELFTDYFITDTMVLDAENHLHVYTPEEETEAVFSR